MEGRGVTNVLLVTTTMRMVYGVHGNTSDSWPGSSSLSLHLVEDATSFADWLVSSATSSDDSNHGSAVAWDGSSASTWESDSCLLSILRVTDDGDGGARGSCEGASISSLSFTVGDNGTFWHLVDWENIANCK